MEKLAFGTHEIARADMSPGVGRTTLELLAVPIQPIEMSGPTPPFPMETAPQPTAPDHTGYPDVTPPDQEYLHE
jgi:hypothetical protein